MLQRYIRERQLDLARSLAGRSKIYLDLCFWIKLRDVAAGDSTNAAANTLLAQLKRGIGTGAIVCPMSECIFVELLKQANIPSRRISTARLMDELSLGVSIVSSQTRIGTEIAYFLHSALGQDLHQLHDLVWTKVGFALGNCYPSMPAVSKDEEFGLQKRFIDMVWQLPPSKVIDLIGDEAVSPGNPFAATVGKINAGNLAHAQALRSFQQVYRAEIRGIVDLCGGMAADVVCDMAKRAGIERPDRGSPQWKSTENMCKNALVAAFEKPTTKSILRTMHIGGSLHAILRWNKGHKIKVNDFYDFEHAAAALAYCDAFFTEGPLCALATAGHASLTEINGCQVSASVEEAIEILSSLEKRAA